MSAPRKLALLSMLCFGAGIVILLAGSDPPGKWTLLWMWLAYAAGAASIFTAWRIG